MYSNRYFCSDVDYVKSNLQKNEVVEYIEVPVEDLPEPVFEDDPSRYWEIWKEQRGYKLYNIQTLPGEVKVLSENLAINDNVVRLYRTAVKIKKAPEKTTL